MFKHVVIHGVGLLGASLGLAMKRHQLAGAITGVGRANSSSLDIARARGAIDHGLTDLAAACQGTHLPTRIPADLVVLCTPIRQFPEAMRILASAVVPGTVITDVGSTKADVMRWAAEILPRSVHFIGSHPMAGSEKSGPDAARDNLYENAVCLLCTPPGAPEEPVQRIRGLWQTLGMRLITLPADTHDQWVATISHLPHALAFALVTTAASHPEMLQAVAGGFLDTTRVASSDASMWTDIFLTNKAALVAALDAFSHDLSTLRSAIAGGNEPSIRDYLKNARQQRDTLLAQRKAAGLSTRSNHTTPTPPECIE
jgi:prephenate dehydrogenase